MKGLHLDHALFCASLKRLFKILISMYVYLIESNAFLIHCVLLLLLYSVFQMNLLLLLHCICSLTTFIGDFDY